MPLFRCCGIIFFLMLAQGTRTIVRDGDFCFGKGLHIIEHKEGSEDNLQAAGSGETRQMQIEVNELRLDWQQIRADFRRNLDRVARDDLDAFAVEQIRA